jgi:DNA-binding MarR family transcriptional regulator/predicted GNAT family acetyltransferase
MSAEIFRRTGQMAMGSRLRQLTDKITSDAGKIDKIYNTCLQPKWFPVFFTLMAEDGLSITEIARIIGHTHASVVTIVKEMTRAGLVRTKQDPKDKRRVVVSLTAKAKRLIPAVAQMCHDVRLAVEEIDAEASQHLWKAIDEWEAKLSEKSLLDRVMAMKVARESDDVQIVDYDDARHHDAFRQLNERWIKELFKIEEEDVYEMDHPMENIINKGGFIYMAEYKGKPVGCFGVMPCERPEYEWEFVKFAVDPNIQGKGIGKRLIEACLERVQSLGAHKIFLETNTKCTAAVHLYEKYGFRHIKVTYTNYERANVHMVKDLG